MIPLVHEFRLHEKKQNIKTIEEDLREVEDLKTSKDDSNLYRNEKEFPFFAIARIVFESKKQCIQLFDLK